MRRRRRSEVFDVVTPTEAERRRAEQRARERRYFLIMGVCLALVLFGFFVPAPIAVRGVALAIGAVLPPVAAIVGNSRPR